MKGKGNRVVDALLKVLEIASLEVDNSLNILFWGPKIWCKKIIGVIIVAKQNNCYKKLNLVKEA